MEDDAQPLPSPAGDVLEAATGPSPASLEGPRRLGPPRRPPRAPPAAGPRMIGVPFEPREMVRFGLIGLRRPRDSLCSTTSSGSRRSRSRPSATWCRRRSREAQAAVAKAGQKPPRPAIAKGDHDFENLCRRGDLDLVYVATPWSWHVPMAVAAMEGGASTPVVEVPVGRDPRGVLEARRHLGARRAGTA